MASPLRVTSVQPVRSTKIVTEDAKIFQALNLKLQIKVNNLESDNERLQNELQNHKGKSQVYEALSKDLASLRKQFDKTAALLLRKCQAYDELKKELTALKAKYLQSPKGTPTRQKPPRVIPVNSCLKHKLELFREDRMSGYSTSDDEGSYISRKSGRPSIGSCGNIVKQITDEEAMPSRLRSYGAPTAPLRNRVLLKLHTLKSASTESLESTGRKSLRKQEATVTKAPVKLKPVSIAPVRKNTGTLSSQIQPPKKFNNGSNPTVKKTTPPVFRGALGQSNGQRMVNIALASVKRSNSNCSTASTTSTASAPPALTTRPNLRKRL